MAGQGIVLKVTGKANLKPSPPAPQPMGEQQLLSSPSCLAALLGSPPRCPTYGP